ncbi:hypothetical protein [Achromobacter sp. MYb9]|uniref:hypothetical protein n=1 Tax=Achromobacter sp. MYb9 TaxID=1827284 RepID=UPI0011B28798|nr:hypothetical protein [Achromobacter sp. MYb9]
MSNDFETGLGKLEAIKTRLDAAPLDVLAESSNVSPADCELMGRFIQQYCFADLNARRIIDLLQHAALGECARNAGNLRDAQVFQKLRDVASSLWASDLKDGLFRASETIEMHRVHRHNFAHWAARRVRGEDALILFTLNATEARRRTGSPPESGELVYALVSTIGLREELDKLVGHTEYLAISAAYIDQNFELFSKKYAGDLAT